MSLADEQKHFVIQKVKEFYSDNGRNIMQHELKALFPRLNLEVLFGHSHDNVLMAAGLLEKDERPPIIPREPKILILDIETKPMLVYCFGLFDQNIGIEQIKEDWSVMAWAAKWAGKEEVYYQDLSNNTDYTKDEHILYGIWELMNEADIVIGQNSIRFDIPKLNGKFEKYGLGPPSPYKSIDTLRIKKKLGLTSNKLAYSTEYFNERFKKLSHGKFPGFSLWTECLKGNKEAWDEMRIYNIQDVNATEELYMNTLRKWDSSIHYGAYSQVQGCCTSCGSTEFTETGTQYTKTGAFASYQCKKCGKHQRDSENLLPKSVRKSFLKSP